MAENYENNSERLPFVGGGASRYIEKGTDNENADNNLPLIRFIGGGLNGHIESGTDEDSKGNIGFIGDHWLREVGKNNSNSGGPLVPPKNEGEVPAPYDYIYFPRNMRIIKVNGEYVRRFV